MAKSGYKKYMKKDNRKDYSIIKLFIFTFFGMLLVFTILIKSFSPTVDTSIGDYDTKEIAEESVNIDRRLANIQDEDNGKDFSEIIRQAEEKIEKELKQQNDDFQNRINAAKNDEVILDTNNTNTVGLNYNSQKPADTVYKVFIGSYSSAEQAKVAKDIISESGLNLSPIVKCIGSNDYTLQVGIYKNKAGADNLLKQIYQNHLPGRIVEDY